MANEFDMKQFNRDTEMINQLESLLKKQIHAEAFEANFRSFYSKFSYNNPHMYNEKDLIDLKTFGFYLKKPVEIRDKKKNNK